jgi:hypothetical protein
MKNDSRRKFIKQVAFGFAALPLSGVLARLSSKSSNAGDAFAASSKEAAPIAPPPGTTPLSEDDPTASALGYHADAKKTDFTRFPARKKPDAKNQFCKTCSQYTAVNAGWGNCQMLTAGVVNANGWCSSWNSKT